MNTVHIDFTSIRRQLIKRRIFSILILIAAFLLLIFFIAAGVWLLFINPDETEIFNLLGTILVLPLGAIVVRQFNVASSRLKYVAITPEQFPDLHQLICECAKEIGLKRVPAAYIVPDPSVNPCTQDFGTRPEVLIGTDFLAGCRENNTPEAIRFMVAHQLGHIKAGHASLTWLTMVAIVRETPVFNTLLARNLEFTADLYANQLAPAGVSDALSLISVGKDNFPYVNPEVQYHRTRRFSFWLFIARWASGTVSAVERSNKLYQLDIERDDSERRKPTICINVQ